MSIIRIIFGSLLAAAIFYTSGVPHNPTQPTSTSFIISSGCTPPLQPFLLSPRRFTVHGARRNSFLVTLLLIGGIEANPGPTTTPSGVNLLRKGNGLQGALLNIRSAVNKAALLHDTIDTLNLDFIALTETW